MTHALSLFAVPAAGLLTLAILTGQGALRRGQGRAMAALSGVFFPLAWVAWQVWDDLPFRHPKTR